MLESTVAEQENEGRVLTDLPVNVLTPPRTSAAGHFRKDHEKVGIIYETNTGANSLKGKRRATAETENMSQREAETPRPVLQYQRRKRKSGDGDSPTIASPPQMPPYTLSTLPPVPSSSFTSGTCEVQPPNRYTRTDKKQQLASPPTTSRQLPPGTATPQETDNANGLRSGHPRTLTSLEGETLSQARQTLEADGDEAQGAPGTRSGEKTSRREQPARAAKKSTPEMLTNPADNLQPGRKSEPGGRKSTRHISKNDPHRRASEPPDANLLPSRRSSSTGISQQPASTRLLPRLLPGGGKNAAPADKPFEFRRSLSPAGRDCGPSNSTPTPAGTRSPWRFDSHLGLGRGGRGAGGSLSEDASAARGSESRAGKMTWSGGKMSKGRFNNDQREFVIQQKVLFADVDAFELEEDDSTSKETVEISPTLPPSDDDEGS